MPKILEEKVDKATALYFNPKSIGTDEGAHCGACMMFVGSKVSTGHCTVVEGNISGKTGVCGLYVHGKHMGPDMMGMLTKEEAGYEEDGPTHCKNCEYFKPKGNEGYGMCEKVEGIVHALGCCQFWIKGKDQLLDIKFSDVGL